MKKVYSPLILLTLIFNFIFCKVCAQNICLYNFNTKNGLPSNHIYTVIKDKYGYLWLSTPNGIAKYNGYDFKIYNISNGLPIEDIWELFEDHKGRIWLGNISEEFGYLLNGKYHKGYLKTDKTLASKTIYPQQLQDRGQGIVFSTPYLSGNKQPTLCFEKNDTFYHSTFSNFFYKNNVNAEIAEQQVYVFYNNSGVPFILYDNIVYVLELTGLTLNAKKISSISDVNYTSIAISTHSFISGDYLISTTGFIIKSNYFKMLNLYKGSVDSVLLSSYVNDNCYILKIYKRKKYNEENIFYILTNKSLLEFETFKNGIKLRNKTLLNRYNNIIDLTSVGFINKDDFWGNAITTNNKGLYIDAGIENHFLKLNINLTGYVYMGGLDDNLKFWTNYGLYKIIKIDNDGNKIHELSFKSLSDMTRMLGYERDSFIINGKKQIFNTHDNKYISNNLLNVNLMNSTIYAGKIIKDSNNTYILNDFNLYRFKVNNKKKSLYKIDYDRYRGLIEDSLRSNYWAYTHDKINIYKKNNDSILTTRYPASFGLKEIKKILIDNKYGTIISMSYNKISTYNFETDTFKELFTNYNLHDANMYLYKNVLIVIGHFGILYSKITGKESFSEPILHNNIKDIFYENVADVQFSSDKILLNTDKGVYQVNIPTDSQLIKNTIKTDTKYKVIAYSKNNIFSIKSGDTILIDQDDPKLQFDVINPYGNGKLQYICKVANNMAQELSANEINLPSLRPDHYYKLSVSASDNVWKSSNINLIIYIRPHWWQTQSAIRVIWIVSIALVILFFTSSVLITRKLVLNATKKKNLRMELELKSIYAQINPHFIFNSLNSALLLVSKNKMDDAYNHISKFSRLLRSYIKSSRNKLIIIDEEVVNLKNYIELQRIRFREKFNYEIYIAPTIASNKIKIPSLLLQPFVENAINHGLLLKEEPGNLKIAFKLSKEIDKLYCIIEDDGVGRKQSRLINEQNIRKDESYGDILIKDLITIFNKYEDMNISVSYIDKELPLSGTVVTIEIKYQHAAE